jgi:hypothetical protein
MSLRSKGLTNGFCNLACRNGQIFSAEVSSDRQCLRWTYSREILCRLRPSDLCWCGPRSCLGVGGAAGGLCGSDDQREPTREKRKNQPDARAVQKTARSAENGREGKVSPGRAQECGQGKTNAGTREVVRSRATSREKTHAR